VGFHREPAIKGEFNKEYGVKMVRGAKVVEVANMGETAELKVIMDPC